MRKFHLCVSVLLLLCFPLLGQDVHEKDVEESPSSERVSVSHNSININGQEMAYTVTTGTYALKNDMGKEQASVFYIAYTRDDARDLGKRPITFSFNGGPGSASVWLHLGALGPRRVLMDSEGGALKPPGKLVDNEASILDHTDLVFIDPVGTGYSRQAKDVDLAQFTGYENDYKAVGEFIRLYVSRESRWESPKFVIGESYGTVRAAGLVHYLQDRHGMYMNGVMLISAALDYQTGDVHPGNDLPFVMFLPTYAATALYHGRVPGTLEDDLVRVLQDAEKFAHGPYHLALMKGDLLSPTEFDRIAEQLAGHIGLSTAYVKRHNLRVPLEYFCQELLRDKQRTVGRLDTRLLGIMADPSSPTLGSDPSFAAILGSYSTTINSYLREELGYDHNAPYRVMAGLRTWKWESGDYINVSLPLRQAMNQNPHLKVFVGNGYFDLATPYFATEYTFNHMGLEKAQQRNVTMAYYPAGHMMYIHHPSLAKFKADLVAFINSACLP